MKQQKKEYLNCYLLQEAKISRLKQMIIINPAKSKEYTLEISKALSVRYEIEKKIKNVDNGILSEILYLKYICGKTLEEIGLLLNYSKRHIERLHIKALEKFEI